MRWSFFQPPSQKKTERINQSRIYIISKVVDIQMNAVVKKDDKPYLSGPVIQFI